ncbi:CPBP family intramembrane glutamic endopeptidase [Thalassotalea marina]|uniref:CAAX amino protease n=1 Tax=Thalassotalea marina TaxID=1673741 RepID=A0A919EIM3_9GAMM|nr:CPBP family intramembrane glutamic endopeptidase [Thalassotalea marina]GHF85056.1 CAAX amino protease [Thalassotalea marina]
MTTTSLPEDKTSSSLLSTLSWLFLLTIVIQFVIAIFITMSDVLSLFVNQQLTMEQYESNPYLLFIGIFFYAIAIIPLLKYALNENNTAPITQQLAFKSVHLKTLTFTVIVTSVFMIFEFSTTAALDVQTPVFMKNYVEQINNWQEIVIAVISISVLAPIAEEVIFRGVAYARIVNSRFGVTGAIVIPSIFFTLIHMQYEQITVFILIFISSILFGVIRHRTQNIWYCILSHSLMNFISLVMLLQD